MPNIKKALDFMIDIANDNSHGYDQTHRNGPDYDCSSLVATALNEAGFNVAVTSYTGNLYEQLKKCGFKKCTKPWKAGDIHLKVGHHVCMSVDANRIVHASINEKGKITGGKTGDQTGKEICIRSYYEYSGGWTYHLRYTAVSKSDESKSIKEIAKQVIDGKWGTGNQRKQKLEAAGYDYEKVQAKVNELVKKDTCEKVALEVVHGKWGNGIHRKERLEGAGYDYEAVQKEVNKLMGL